MKSKQVILTLVLLTATGCTAISAKLEQFAQKGVPSLESPYPTRHVWAIAPLRNESGNSHADGLVLADRLARQLENAANLDVLPVNRVLQAMAALELPVITSPSQAMRLVETLGIDGLIVGTVSTYDPYDPPKLGLAIELYTNPRVDAADVALNARSRPSPGPGSLNPGSSDSLASLQRLSWSATTVTIKPALPDDQGQPVSVVSGYFDGFAPEVQTGLRHYAHDRGPTRQDENWHRYLISMDLYSEFVSYVMSWRLLRTESLRMESAETMSSATP